MEYDSVEMIHDHDDVSTRNEPAEPVKSEMVVVGDRIQQSSKEVIQANKVDTKDGESVSGEVNMEASISADDVMRAGGFGARDDISCLLPGASDSTDFEASLLYARDYEEPQEAICRPGLGWKDVRESN